MSEAHESLVICRCEEATRAEISEAIRAGCRTLDEVKRMTRAGMGRCQGRCCGPMIADLLSREGDIPELEIVPFTAQFPATPIDLGSLSDLGPDADENCAGSSRGGEA